VLNRRYKPLGFHTDDFIFEYGEYPILVSLPGMTKKLAQRLDHKGRDDVNNIYLYADLNVPTATKEHMQAYLDRLALLMKMQVRWGDDAAAPVMADHNGEAMDRHHEP
jgi:hypothetical protein